MENKTLLGALNAALRRPDETIKQFAEQVRKLTPEDKATLAAWFEAEGQYRITDREAPSAAG